MHDFEPKFPFDGYQDKEDAEYVEMMQFIVNVESIQAKALGEWGVKNLKPASVIDLGCGPGLYLLPYKKANCDVFGVDACSAGGQLLEFSEFVRFDLRFPFHPSDFNFPRFDLAICFETAEHLHEHYADRLVDTLCDCAGTIIFSAAVPGQGGTFHYNEQPHEYWLTKFKERHNYGIHPKHAAMRKMLEKFRPEEARGEVSGWIINNSFLLQEGA